MNANDKAVFDRIDGVLDVLKRELLDVKLAEALDTLAEAMGGPRLYQQAVAGAQQIRTKTQARVLQLRTPESDFYCQKCRGLHAGAKTQRRLYGKVVSHQRGGNA